MCVVGGSAKKAQTVRGARPCYYYYYYSLTLTPQKTPPHAHAHTPHTPHHTHAPLARSLLLRVLHDLVEVVKELAALRRAGAEQQRVWPVL